MMYVLLSSILLLLLGVGIAMFLGYRKQKTDTSKTAVSVRGDNSIIQDAQAVPAHYYKPVAPFVSHENVREEVLMDTLRKWNSFAKSMKIDYIVSGDTLLGYVRDKCLRPSQEIVSVMLSSDSYEALDNLWEQGTASKDETDAREILPSILMRRTSGGKNDTVVFDGEPVHVGRLEKDIGTQATEFRTSNVEIRVPENIDDAKELLDSLYGQRWKRVRS